MLKCLLFLLFVSSLFSRDFNNLRENEIHSFILYNYDVLITQCYTAEKIYFNDLSTLLTATVENKKYFYTLLLEDKTLCLIDNPADFMYEINDLLKKSNINKQFVDR